jgi:hypothetical protein
MIEIRLPTEESSRIARLPGCDRKTQRLEFAAFLGVGLMAGSIILMAANNGLEFGANEDAIVAAFGSPQHGIESKNGSGTNISASVPLPIEKRSATSPRT